MTIQPIDKTDSVLVVPQTNNTSAAEDELIKQSSIAVNSLTNSKIRITQLSEETKKETKKPSVVISVGYLEQKS